MWGRFLYTGGYRWRRDGKWDLRILTFEGVTCWICLQKQQRTWFRKPNAVLGSAPYRLVQRRVFLSRTHQQYANPRASPFATEYENFVSKRSTSSHKSFRHLRNNPHLGSMAGILNHAWRGLICSDAVEHPWRGCFSSYLWWFLLTFIWLATSRDDKGWILTLPVVVTGFILQQTVPSESIWKACISSNWAPISRWHLPPPTLLPSECGQFSSPLRSPCFLPPDPAPSTGIQLSSMPECVWLLFGYTLKLSRVFSPVSTGSLLCDPRACSPLETNFLRESSPFIAFCSSKLCILSS